MSELAMGMVGLGVMGRNLALNLEEKGFSVAAYDAWPDPVDRFVAESAGKRVEGFKALEAFVRAIARPRKIVLLVKAGDVVDKTLAALAPLLDTGDLVIDGGNEHFSATERRAKELQARGLQFFGMGISGGEEGARRGPSLMPGGDREAYAHVADMLARVAAPHTDGPCVTWVGPGGAGHYAKMVHNGIEYGDMQLIAEAYDLLRTLGGLDNAAIADTFARWNDGELGSFLIEITAEVLRKKDELAGGDLVDVVVDESGMKGTGKWTVQDAAEIGSAVPTIAAAVEARILSANRAARVAASRVLAGPRPAAIDGVDRDALVRDVGTALLAAKVCAYAQGMALLRRASELRGWGMNLAELARIWQAGCIIRARLLGRIKAAFAGDPALGNLLLDPGFVEVMASHQDALRRVVALGTAHGVPVHATASALAYYDSVRRERLPANLIQAQRDRFGAHGYARTDREGSFHSDWRSR